MTATGDTARVARARLEGLEELIFGPSARRLIGLAPTGGGATTAMPRL